MRAISRRDALILSAGVGLLAATRSSRSAHAEEDLAKLAFSEMYVPGSVDFTPKLQRLDSKRVLVPGYMAPPLKPEATFFVLTSVPMATCPYCDDAMSWPDSIVLVRTRAVIRVIDFDRRIAVNGRLELGTDIDKDTGFVSRVRLMDAQYSRI